MKILVAGVGNVFLGDDGFGVEVARRLEGESFPAGVSVVDYGIRGIHLACDLLQGYDVLILVDAAPRGEPPGTLFVLEPEPEAAAPDGSAGSVFVPDAHGMNPERVLGMLRELGGQVGRVWIVGCEPATVEEGMGLSPPVAAAVDGAARLVRELVARALGKGSAPVPVRAAERKA